MTRRRGVAHPPDLPQRFCRAMLLGIRAIYLPCDTQRSCSSDHGCSVIGVRWPWLGPKVLSATTSALLAQSDKARRAEDRENA